MSCANISCADSSYSFCRHWRKEEREREEREGEEPISHVRGLMEMLFCPKPDAPEESGYGQKFPGFKPSCILDHCCESKNH